jgi:ribonucleoside-triphosphate reductase
MCRAYLSDFIDKNSGKHVFTSRANIGACALNLPMIWKKSDGVDFYKDLDYSLELIRQFLIKRYDYVANQPCSTNPLAFTQGGLYRGFKKESDKIGYDIVESFTASFGITALNELNILMEGKQLHESDRRSVNKVLIWKVYILKKTYATILTFRCIYQLPIWKYLLMLWVKQSPLASKRTTKGICVTERKD